MIQIYNTQTRKKEPFEPLNPPVVTIYNCGPTVYDHFHIGNARNFVFMDIVRRYFEFRGYRVRFVQNLTDIEDKIINRANEEGIPCDQITRRFIQCYFEDAAKLRIRPADVHPRATEHIPEIIEHVQRLIDGGLAYVANGSVYFSVEGFREYGKLSGRRVEDLLDGARVEVNDEKRSPADFVLWKAAKPGEPSWESPWGPGRPGWHIECSVMSMKHLGETIDIHSGGTDLTFPHHENEIAQSEGATGKPFVRCWMHNGFLNIDSRKMSKSLGNFLKIDRILDRYSPATVRHFLLSAHYRSPLDLTETAMEESGSAVARINDAIATGQKLLAMEKVATPAEPADEIRQLRDAFERAMDDDFNTPRALAVLFEAVSLIHEARHQVADVAGEQRPAALARLAALTALAADLRDFFGLEPEAEPQPEADGLVAPLMDLLIETRAMARKQKAFAIADAIRSRLDHLGIALEDHPQGTIWKRK